MRLLHIITAPPINCEEGLAHLDAALLACACVPARPGGEHRFVLIGGAQAARRAARLAAPISVRVAAPLGLPMLATRPLRQALRAFGPVDAAVCWSAAAAAPARAALGSTCRLVVIPSAPPQPRDLAIAADPRAAIAAAPAADPSAWHAAGVPSDRVLHPPSPACITVPTPAASRDELRAALGVERAGTILVLAGRHPHADALRFAFLCWLLHLSGAPVVGVLPTGATQRRRAERYVAALREPVRLVVADEPFPSLLAAADLAVFVGGGEGPTRPRPTAPFAADPDAALAHARGVPLIAPRPAVDPSLYSGAAPCLATSHVLADLARVLRPIVLDPAARRALSARVEAAARAGDRDRAFFGAIAAAAGRS